MPFDTPSEQTWTCIIHLCVFSLPGSEVKCGEKDLAGLCSQLDKNLTSCKQKKKKGGFLKLSCMKDYCQHRSWYLRRFHCLFFTVENVCDPEWLAQTLLFTADIFKAFPANSSVTALAQTYRRDVVRSTEHSEKKKTIHGHRESSDLRCYNDTFIPTARIISLRHTPRERCLLTSRGMVCLYPHWCCWADPVWTRCWWWNHSGRAIWLLVAMLWPGGGYTHRIMYCLCLSIPYMNSRHDLWCVLSLSCLFSCLWQEVVVSLITSFWCLFHWDEYHQIAINQYIPVSFLVYFTGSLLSRPQRKGRSKITCIVRNDLRSTLAIIWNDWVLT